MESLTIPGRATIKGSGTVSGWWPRIVCAWRVLVYGQVRFTITAESLTLSPEPPHGD